MRQVGAGLAASGALGGGVDMRETNAAIANVGSRIVAMPKEAAGASVNSDGATFHGVPDQRYVSSIMDSATRMLRSSSRSWAFNPAGQ
jgi:hypothetical protein